MIAWLRSINKEQSIVKSQPSTVNRQPSTVNRQPSTVISQPSTNHGVKAALTSSWV
ncbi:hypothetical protein H6G64_31115 [Calothrix sp. FACHB-156]|nr:hypothetical protein [Calothrix sp. FACHB-156]